MNKQAIRKAFFVCASIGLVYAALAFNIQDRFSMKRTYQTSVKKAPKSLNVAVPGPDNEPSRQAPIIAGNQPSIEPSLLIALPIIAYSIREGLIEREGMILVKRTDDPSSVYLKKPLDILKDKDSEGLRTLTRIIGKKNIEAFLSQEGVKLPDRSLPFDALAGTGYSIDSEVLVALYNKYVGAGFDPLIPFAAGGFEVSRKGRGFEIGKIRKEKQAQAVRNGAAWIMPDLSGLSMKAALDRISAKGQAIKIYGSGVVASQYPNPQEKVEKETRCILYGRTYQK
ncbi:MAG: PASTA domain-containing protein [Syntrophorhabdaceae bacterium]|nr:PASTA domain-containing protein [Syntrophorhabdaceae bacterium]